MNDIIQIISNVGFPITMCLMMGVYVKTEMKEITRALNNNTLAIEKLCENVIMKGVYKNDE